MRLFQPELLYVGSVYSAILQAFIDIQNLSELLAHAPDVRDDPNAPPLLLDATSNGVSVEFKDVTFHYPEQDSLKGLRNVSFSVAAGSSAAIIGHTGAGIFYW